MKKKKIKLDLLTSITFILVLSFYISSSLLDLPIIIPTFGKYLFLTVVLLISVLLIQRKSFSSNEIKIFLPFVLFITVYFINLKSLSDTDGIMIILNQLFYLITIYMVCSVSWTKFQIKSLSHVYYIALPILLIMTFLLPRVLNTNTIGSFAFYLSFFPLLYLIGYSINLTRSRIIFIFALSSLVILVSDTRSILLSAAVGIFTFIAWKFISKRKVFFHLYFFAVIAVNYFIVVVYPNMYKWDNFYKLNEISINLTGKPLMTGRNTIWAQLVDVISLKPWLGYGASVLPEDFLSISFSAHNLYLQTALQTGIIGVVLLAIFFFFIWKSFWENRHDSKIILVASFFIGIIMHQSFEVTLTQNYFSIGLLQWIIIAMGLHYSLNKNSKKSELN